MNAILFGLGGVVLIAASVFFLYLGGERRIEGDHVKAETFGVAGFFAFAIGVAGILRAAFLARWV